MTGGPGGTSTTLTTVPCGRRKTLEPPAHFERDLVAGPAALGLGREIDLQIALLRLVAQIGVAHETVEVERRGRARIGLDRGQLLAESARRLAAAASTRSVSSSDAPRGRSTTTCSSDLSSNGRSLTVTDLVANRRERQQRRDADGEQEAQGRPSRGE